MSSINRAENTLSQQLVQRIKYLEQATRELKTSVQPIGGDVLKVQSLPTGGYAEAGPFNLTAGSSGTFVATFVPVSQTLTLWNVLWSVFVDTDTSGYQFPSGSSLSSAQRSLRVSSWFDWGDSSDTTNVRVYKVRIENTDTSAHNYYLKVRAYLPLLTGSASS